MKQLAFALLFASLAGCASVTPNYDTRFGEAVRQSRLAMTINPDAGRNPDQAAGIDGKPAQASMNRYDKSFEAPPPATNVINIGGAIGSSSGGGGR